MDIPAPEAFFRPLVLMVVLLNPFIMSIYLLDLLQTLERAVFVRTIARAAIISMMAFAVFAVGGDAVFSDVFQIRFASFMIFGGFLFLVIGLRLASQGPDAMSQFRGEPQHLAGAVAMPFMIGPGTVSASVLAGARLPPLWAILSIACALIITVVGLLLVKIVHDRVKAQNSALVERYVDLVGRISALLIGSIAIDMVLSGIEIWLRLRH